MLAFAYFYLKKSTEYITISKDPKLDSFYRTRIRHLTYLYIYPNQAIYYNEKEDSIRKIGE